MNDFYRTERSSSLTRSLGGAHVSMLGLEGYGSGSDDDSGAEDGGGRVTLVRHSPSPPPEPAPEPAPLDLTSRLPAPRVTTGSLFASVPKPGKTKGAAAEDNGGRRRVVTLKPAPAAAAALGPDSDDDDDDDRAAKRRRTAPTGGAGLRATLPKPKNALGAGGPAGGLELDAPGLGAGGGGAQLDLGAAGDTAGHRGHAGPEPSNLAPHPSTLYAVDESGAYAYDADAQARYHAEYARYYGHHPHQGGPSGGELSGGGVGLEEAGRDTAAGAGGPGSFDVDAVMRRAGVDGSHVRGISAAELRASGGDRIRESATTGLAFDDEYRDKLTREAGHAPSLVHKSKNQIGSLLYNAKQAELKIMEGRLQGVSHKAQARQKYGW